MKHRLFLLGATLALTVAILTVGMNNQGVAPLNATYTTPPVAQELNSRLLFGGDIYWGRLFERNHPNDYAFPFSGLDTLSKENYDAWIANVECPITDEIVSFEDQWEAIQFNCQPEYLPELAKWFDVVSLANNHTDNVRGEEGLATTRANLESAGIQYFGHYEPDVLEDLCEVVTVSAQIIYDTGEPRAVSLPIAMCGYHGVFKTFTDDQIEHLTQYSKHFLTISMPHAGAEYKAISDPIRQRAYRAMIDAGADAVLGNHPHWVQNTEEYNGKLIVYSMGNLIFDQQFNDEVTRSAMIDMTISIMYSDELEKYINVVDSCAEYKDECLEKMTMSGVERPEMLLEYVAVPTRTTGLITSIDPNGSKSLDDRLQWWETKSALRQATPSQPQ